MLGMAEQFCFVDGFRNKRPAVGGQNTIFHHSVSGTFKAGIIIFSPEVQPAVQKEDGVRGQHELKKIGNPILNQ
jgi:hypothetical protein